jgi:hypothetical protein
MEMMPKVEIVTRYKCAGCGMVFNTAQEAEECFDQHKRAISLIDVDYPGVELRSHILGGYPRACRIAFDDGSIAEYIFAGTISDSAKKTKPVTEKEVKA